MTYDDDPDDSLFDEHDFEEIDQFSEEAPPRESSSAFFLLPAVALKSLRDELVLTLGEEHTTDILYRLGLRCGQSGAGDVEDTIVSFDELSEILPELWMHLGLSMIMEQEPMADGTELIIRTRDSIEAEVLGEDAEPVCHFSKGYLEGLISTIMDTKYSITEKDCIAQGKPLCTYHLKPVTDELIPQNEKQADSALKYNLTEGLCYLVKSNEIGLGYTIFKDLVTHDRPGFCVTREYPKKIKDTYGLANTPVVWLSREEEPSITTITPQQLGRLNYIIEDVLKKNSSTVVMLDGVEYMVTQNSFVAVLKLLQLIKDRIAIYNAIMLIPISLDALEEKDIKLLEREFNVFTESEEDEDSFQDLIQKMVSAAKR